MTRAEYIRHIYHPSMIPTTIADLCVLEGYERPSRQAIESALAKSGTRGRPTERAKCPTCGQRVSGPIDLRAPHDYAQGRCAEGEYVWVHGGNHDAATVADVSQTPKTKRTKRKGTKSKS